ncbi:MAG: class I SAM-dependent methyltransferase [Deltaproteobacteria bacterium]|nr:class I SAM-dependent methyltransferase [Deltaproteobacteria bacterium]
MNPCCSKFAFEILFDESGKSYGAPRWKYEKRVDWILDNVNLPSGSTILDLGCHDGELLSMLPDSFKRVGVDIDQSSLSAGKKKYPDIHFIKADLESFQFEGKPDAITMIHVLEHLPDPAAVLHNLHSISHGETLLVIEVPIIEKGATADISGFFSVTHLTHFSSSGLRRFLHSTGWQVLKWEVEPSYNGLRVLAKSACRSGRPETSLEETGLLYDYLAEHYRSLAKVEQRLSKATCEQLCVIWGAGLHTELLYQSASFFRQDSGREYIIVDSDPLKWGKSWRGIPICKPEMLKNIDWNKSSLVISSYASQSVIERAAKDLGVPNDKIVKIYDIEG